MDAHYPPPGESLEMYVAEERSPCTRGWVEFVWSRDGPTAEGFAERLAARFHVGTRVLRVTMCTEVVSPCAACEGAPAQGETCHSCGRKGDGDGP